jgi:hypothetical protein
LKTEKSFTKNALGVCIEKEKERSLGHTNDDSIGFLVSCSFALLSTKVNRLKSSFSFSVLSLKLKRQNPI